MRININKTFHEKINSELDSKGYGKFDIITMSNFLNFNEGKNIVIGSSIINLLYENVKKDGSVIVIEPGDETSCRNLKKLRNRIIADNKFNVYSPCIGIWENKNKYDCSCFNMVRFYWDLPEIYEYFINRGLKKARRNEIPFTYMIFRRDGLRKYQIVTNRKHYVRLSDLDDHTDKYINTIAIVRTVIKRGNNDLSISLCDGSICNTNDSQAVWMELSHEEMGKQGIN